MTEKQCDAVKLALAVLGPFKESGLYEDYKSDEGFTDEQYEDILAAMLIDVSSTTT